MAATGLTVLNIRGPGITGTLKVRRLVIAWVRIRWFLYFSLLTLLFIIRQCVLE